MPHSILIFCLIALSVFSHLQAEETDENSSPKTHKSSEATEADKDSSSKTHKSPHKLSGSVAFVTDYRSRGISETLRRPAVQGQLVYTHTSGFYAKTWASNTDGTCHLYNNTSLEWDFFLGIQQRVENTPLSCEIGLVYYYYPGGKTFLPRQVSYDTLEYYIGLKYKIFELKLFQDITDFYGTNSHSPPFNWHKMAFARPNGHSRGSTYLEATFQWSPYSKWTTSLQLGYQIVVNYSELNYFYWQVGVTREFAWVEASLYYVDTTGRSAFYDVLDHAFHPSNRRIAGPGVYLAVTRKF